MPETVDLDEVWPREYTEVSLSASLDMILGFRPYFGDMTLWNILASCAVLLYTSPYPYVTNVRRWAHGRSVASQPAAMEGGTRVHLDTGHHCPDSLVK